jgi:tRNA A37 threonylcarbamoyladenosine synthetase subunit TsaC/SUA5/YrdC
VVAASVHQVKTVFPASRAQLSCITPYWPGAVSLVVSTRLAVRVPANAQLRHLAKLVGAPIIVSSLNISRHPALYDLGRLPKRFKDLPQLNVGKLKRRLPSTVVTVRRGHLVVLRPGRVTIKTL